MNVLINNTIKSLCIIDPKTGCEWTQDLIGNADGFLDFDESNALHTMSSDDYNWWYDYIQTEQKIQNEINQLLVTLPQSQLEKFERDLADAGDPDYKTMQDNLIDLTSDFKADCNAVI